jgi:TM2 domain-containing membrane protein YozV
MNDSDLALFLGSLVALAVIGGFIYLIKKSNREAQKTEELYSQIALNLPQDKQMIFLMQYNNVKKNGTTAVLLALLLGGLGAHKFYMGQTGQGILYLLFCWTYIPTLIALIEAFFLPARVSQHNQRKMAEIATLLGVTNKPLLDAP